MVSEDFNFKIREVIPRYDYKNVIGGHFEVHFGYESSNPFKLSFGPFLNHRMRTDEGLYNYVKKISDESTEDLTCSHVIFDLYDLGFPVDEWVEDYFKAVRNNVNADLFDLLMQFYNHLKNFGGESESTGSLE
jgi:hypothetical protein